MKNQKSNTKSNTSGAKTKTATKSSATKATKAIKSPSPKIVTPKVTMTKEAVSTPAQALALFREFAKNTNATAYTVSGSRAKWYSVQQMVAYFATKNRSINGGWLGRALNGVTSGITISTIRNSDGRSISIYRSGSSAPKA